MNYTRKIIIAMIIIVMVFVPLSDHLLFAAYSNIKLVINEVLYDPRGRTIANFVELYGTPGLKLDGYYLVGVNGQGGAKYNLIDLVGCEISSSGFFVVAQNNTVPNANKIDRKADYQNGSDNIELWNMEEKVDAVGYGDFSNAIFTGEGSPALDLVGYSIGRRPDGFDSNNNSFDFVGLTIPTPGAPNGPVIAVDQNGKHISRWGFIKKQ